MQLMRDLFAGYRFRAQQKNQIRVTRYRETWLDHFDGDAGLHTQWVEVIGVVGVARDERVDVESLRLTTELWERVTVDLLG